MSARGLLIVLILLAGAAKGPKDRARSPDAATVAGDGPTDARPASAHSPQPLAAATRVVVQAIARAAEHNHRLPARGVGFGERPGRFSGDRLTEHLFRRAAAAAKDLPPDVAARAYLLGLGIALDDSGTLRHDLITGHLCRRVESDPQRKRRLAVLGNPTMRGRRDLAKHFVVSSALAVLVSPQVAESLGILKEISDSHGGTGFSFVDLSADLAGVTFATHVSRSKIPLARLANSFSVEDFVPEKGDVREGISWEAFQAAYGSTEDERFQRQQAAIRRRILALPGYELME